MIRFWIEENNKSWLRGVTILLTASFLFTTLCAPFAQASFWEERRKSVEEFKKENQALHVAALGSASALVPNTLQLPIPQSKITPNWLAEALQRVKGDSFSRKKVKGVPPEFLERISKFGEIEKIALVPGENLTLTDGKLQSKYPLVLQIQDAHGVYGVQKNISSLLKDLMNMGVGFVGVEGTEGLLEGVERWRKYPDRESLMGVAGFLLKQGLLTGVEIAALSRERESVDFYGMEESNKYLEQVHCFKDTLKENKEVERWITQLSKKIEESKKSAFTPELMNLDNKNIQYEKGEIKLGEWLQYLVGTDPKGVCPHRRLSPQISRYIQAYRLEKELNFKEVEIDQKKLLARLSASLSQSEMRELLEESLLYRLGQIGFGEFYGRLEAKCEKNGIDLTPGMKKYMEYAVKVEGIKRDSLFKELKALENTTWLNLIGLNNKAKELHELEKNYALLEKAIDFRLSTEEWEEYSSAPVPSVVFTSPQVLEVLANVKRFNELSHERSKIFADKLHERMGEKLKLAALVAGGYHSRGIEERLANHAVSCVTIRPRMDLSQIKENYHPLNSFKRDLLPLEKLFLPEKVSLAYPPAWGKKGAISQTILPTIRAVESTLKGAVPVVSKVNGGNPAELTRFEIKGEVVDAVIGETKVLASKNSAAVKALAPKGSFLGETEIAEDSAQTKVFFALSSLHPILAHSQSSNPILFNNFSLFTVATLLVGGLGFVLVLAGFYGLYALLRSKPLALVSHGEDPQTSREIVAIPEDLALGEKRFTLKVKNYCNTTSYGFEITEDAFQEFLKINGLVNRIQELTRHCDTSDIQKLALLSEQAQEIIRNAEFPEEVKKAIYRNYAVLNKRFGLQEADISVQVKGFKDSKTSPLEEIKGFESLLDQIKEAFASYYSVKALESRNARLVDTFINELGELSFKKLVYALWEEKNLSYFASQLETRRRVSAVLLLKILKDEGFKEELKVLDEVLLKAPSFESGMGQVYVQTKIPLALTLSVASPSNDGKLPAVTIEASKIYSEVIRFHPRALWDYDHKNKWMSVNHPKLTQEIKEALEREEVASAKEYFKRGIERTLLQVFLPDSTDHLASSNPQKLVVYQLNDMDSAGFRNLRGGDIYELEPTGAVGLSRSLLKENISIFRLECEALYEVVKRPRGITGPSFGIQFTQVKFFHEFEEALSLLKSKRLIPGKNVQIGLRLDRFQNLHLSEEYLNLIQFFSFDKPTLFQNIFFGDFLGKYKSMDTMFEVWQAIYEPLILNFRTLAQQKGVQEIVFEESSSRAPPSIKQWFTTGLLSLFFTIISFSYKLPAFANDFSSVHFKLHSLTSISLIALSILGGLSLFVWKYFQQKESGLFQRQMLTKILLVAGGLLPSIPIGDAGELIQSNEGKTIPKDNPAIEVQALDDVVTIILDDFTHWWSEYRRVALGRVDVFKNKKWDSKQEDWNERILRGEEERVLLYEVAWNLSQESIKRLLAKRPEYSSYLLKQDFWDKNIEKEFLKRVSGFYQAEIAHTFYRTVYRKIFSDEYYEMDKFNPDPLLGSAAVTYDSLIKNYPATENLTMEELLKQIIQDFSFGSYENLDGDVEIAAAYIRKYTNRNDGLKNISNIEIFPDLFVRGKAAYIFGKIVFKDGILPLAIKLSHGRKGVSISRIFVKDNEVNHILSFTRSAFYFDINHYREFIAFIKTLIPKKRIALIYYSLGFWDTAKTKWLEQVAKRVSEAITNGEQFGVPPGVPGGAMFVFMLENFDMVFKVIRDNFAEDKIPTSKEKIMKAYDLVHSTERGGRLIDTIPYKNLRFPIELFTPELLADIKNKFKDTITIEDSYVTIRHLYFQRKIIPLPSFVSDFTPDLILKVLLDLGSFLKELVMSNIDLGDYYSWNVGVLVVDGEVFNVVTYDFDEITKVTDLRLIRDLTEDEIMLGQASSLDLFAPEQISHFILPNNPKITREMKEQFQSVYGEILTADWWNKIKAKLKANGGRPLYFLHHSEVDYLEFKKRYLAEQKKLKKSPDTVAVRLGYELGYPLTKAPDRAMNKKKKTILTIQESPLIEEEKREFHKRFSHFKEMMQAHDYAMELISNHTNSMTKKIAEEILKQCEIMVKKCGELSPVPLQGGLNKLVEALYRDKRWNALGLKDEIPQDLREKITKFEKERKSIGEIETVQEFINYMHRLAVDRVPILALPFEEKNEEKNIINLLITLGNSSLKILNVSELPVLQEGKVSNRALKCVLKGFERIEVGKNPFIVLEDKNLFYYNKLGKHSHIAGLYAHLVPPSEGGLITFRYSEGGTEIGYQLRMEFVASVLKGLGFSVERIGLQNLKAVLDKNHGCKSLREIEKALPIIFRCISYTSYLDMDLEGIYSKKREDLENEPAYEEAIKITYDIAKIFLAEGASPFNTLIGQYPSTLDPFIYDLYNSYKQNKERDALRSAIQRALRKLGLPQIPKGLDFGQEIIDHYYTEPIRKAIARGELILDDNGVPFRNPNYEPIKILVKALLQSKMTAMECANAVNTLDPSLLSFEPIGSVGQCIAVRTQLELESGMWLTLLGLSHPQTGWIHYLMPMFVSDLGDLVPLDSNEFISLMQSEGFEIYPGDRPTIEEMMLAEQLLWSQFQSPSGLMGAVVSGFPASRGNGKIAIGKVTFKPHFHRESQTKGKNRIFVAPYTTPDDLDAIQFSEAVVTTGGGLLTHTGIVIRELGIPLVLLPSAVWGVEMVGETARRVLKILYQTPSQAYMDSHNLWISDQVQTQHLKVYEGDVLIVDGGRGLIAVLPQKAQKFIGRLDDLMDQLLEGSKSIEDLREWFQLNKASKAISWIVEFLFFRRVVKDSSMERGLAMEISNLISELESDPEKGLEIKERLNIVRKRVLESSAENIKKGIRKTNIELPKANAVVKNIPSQKTDDEVEKMANSTVISLSNVDDDYVHMVGRKASKLGEVSSVVRGLGGNIPEGFAVTTRAFAQFLKENGLEDKFKQITDSLTQEMELEKKNAAVENYSDQIRDLILSGKLDGEVGIGKDILDMLNRLGMENYPLAVRSSAVYEDTAKAAFAGAAETYLYVQKPQLFEKVKEVWISFWTPRAVQYRLIRGISQGSVNPAVFVQKMVNSDVSGVLFTMDPNNGQPMNVINAAYGLGEGVTTGDIPLDEYRSSKEDGTEIEIPKISDKRIQVVQDRSGSGTAKTFIPNPLRKRRALSPQQVKELSVLGHGLEAHFGYPLDIEFAIEKNQIYILQVRPVTTNSKKSFSQSNRPPPIVTSLILGFLSFLSITFPAFASTDIIPKTISISSTLTQKKANSSIRPLPQLQHFLAVNRLSGHGLSLKKTKAGMEELELVNLLNAKVLRVIPVGLHDSINGVPAFSPNGNAFGILWTRNYPQMGEFSFYRVYNLNGEIISEYPYRGEKFSPDGTEIIIQRVQLENNRFTIFYKDVSNEIRTITIEYPEDKEDKDSKNDFPVTPVLIGLARSKTPLTLERYRKYHIDLRNLVEAKLKKRYELEGENSPSLEHSLQLYDDIIQSNKEDHLKIRPKNALGGKVLKKMRAQFVCDFDTAELLVSNFLVERISRFMEIVESSTGEGEFFGQFVEGLKKLRAQMEDRGLVLMRQQAQTIFRVDPFTEPGFESRVQDRLDFHLARIDSILDTISPSSDDFAENLYDLMTDFICRVDLLNNRRKFLDSYYDAYNFVSVDEVIAQFDHEPWKGMVSSISGGYGSGAFKNIYEDYKDLSPRIRKGLLDRVEKSGLSWTRVMARMEGRRPFSYRLIEYEENDSVARYIRANNLSASFNFIDADGKTKYVFLPEHWIFKELARKHEEIELYWMVRLNGETFHTSFTVGRVAHILASATQVVEYMSDSDPEFEMIFREFFRTQLEGPVPTSKLRKLFNEDRLYHYELILRYLGADSEKSARDFEEGIRLNFKKMLGASTEVADFSKYMNRRTNGGGLKDLWAKHTQLSSKEKVRLLYYLEFSKLKLRSPLVTKKINKIVSGVPIHYELVYYDTLNQENPISRTLSEKKIHGAYHLYMGDGNGIIFIPLGSYPYGEMGLEHEELEVAWQKKLTLDFKEKPMLPLGAKPNQLLREKIRKYKWIERFGIQRSAHILAWSEQIISNGWKEIEDCPFIKDQIFQMDVRQLSSLLNSRRDAHFMLRSAYFTEDQVKQIEEFEGSVQLYAKGRWTHLMAKGLEEVYPKVGNSILGEGRKTIIKKRFGVNNVFYQKLLEHIRLIPAQYKVDTRKIVNGRTLPFQLIRYKEGTILDRFLLSRGIDGAFQFTDGNVYVILLRYKKETKEDELLDVNHFSDEEKVALEHELFGIDHFERVREEVLPMKVNPTKAAHILAWAQQIAKRGWTKVGEVPFLKRQIDVMTENQLLELINEDRVSIHRALVSEYLKRLTWSNILTKKQIENVLEFEKSVCSYAKELIKHNFTRTTTVLIEPQEFIVPRVPPPQDGQLSLFKGEWVLGIGMALIWNFWNFSAPHGAQDSFPMLGVVTSVGILNFKTQIQKFTEKIKPFLWKLIFDSLRKELEDAWEKHRKIPFGRTEQLEFAQTVEPLAQKWLAKHRWLIQYLLPLTLEQPQENEEYHRNPLLKSDHAAFFAHVWKSGGATRIHNHDGKMAFTIPVSDGMNEESFELLEDPKENWDGKVVEGKLIKSQFLKPFGIYSLTRGMGSIHRISNGAKTKGTIIEIYLWEQPFAEFNTLIPVEGNNQQFFVQRVLGKDAVYSLGNSISMGATLVAMDKVKEELKALKDSGKPLPKIYTLHNTIIMDFEMALSYLNRNFPKVFRSDDGAFFFGSRAPPTRSFSNVRSSPAHVKVIFPSGKLPKDYEKELRKKSTHQIGGLVLAPVIASLNQKVVLSLFKIKGWVTMEEILDFLSSRGIHGNAGNLHHAFWLLASLGWIEREGDSASQQMKFQLTLKGFYALEKISAYSQIINFMPIGLGMKEFLFGRLNPAVSFNTFMELSRKNWGLPKSGDQDKQSVWDRMILHLDGLLIGSILAALKIHLKDNGIQVDKNEEPLEVEFKGNLTHLNQVFDFLGLKGLVRKEGDSFIVTPEGKFSFYMASRANGITAAYLPMFAQMDALHYGDPNVIWKQDENGKETHIDRHMNALASGESHEAYYELIEQEVVKLFNLPIKRQPRYVLDTGCGDGEFLEMVYRTVLTKTKRGQLIQRNPSKHKLTMLGADSNQESLDASIHRLENVKIEADGKSFEIPHLIVNGNVNDPDGLMKTLASLGIKEEDGILNLSSFLYHNRTLVFPGNIDPNRKSSSTGTFSFRGSAIPNEIIEEDLVHFLKKWAPHLKRFGLFMRELHTLDPELIDENEGETYAIAFAGTHGYSDQYIVEQSVFLKCAREAGLVPVFLKSLKNDELSTISILYLQYDPSLIEADTPKLESVAIPLIIGLAVTAGIFFAQPAWSAGLETEPFLFWDRLGKAILSAFGIALTVSVLWGVIDKYMLNEVSKEGSSKKAKNDNLKLYILFSWVGSLVKISLSLLVFPITLLLIIMEKFKQNPNKNNLDEPKVKDNQEPMHPKDDGNENKPKDPINKDKENKRNPHPTPPVAQGVPNKSNESTTVSKQKYISDIHSSVVSFVAWLTATQYESEIVNEAFLKRLKYYYDAARHKKLWVSNGLGADLISMQTIADDIKKELKHFESDIKDFNLIFRRLMADISAAAIGAFFLTFLFGTPSALALPMTEFSGSAFREVFGSLYLLLAFIFIPGALYAVFTLNPLKKSEREMKEEKREIRKIKYLSDDHEFNLKSDLWLNQLKKVMDRKLKRAQDPKSDYFKDKETDRLLELHGIFYGLRRDDEKSAKDFEQLFQSLFKGDIGVEVIPAPNTLLRQFEITTINEVSAEEIKSLQSSLNLIRFFKRGSLEKQELTLKRVEELNRYFLNGYFYAVETLALMKQKPVPIQKLPSMTTVYDLNSFFNGDKLSSRFMESVLKKTISQISEGGEKIVFICGRSTFEMKREIERRLGKKAAEALSQHSHQVEYWVMPAEKPIALSAVRDLIGTTYFQVITDDASRWEVGKLTAIAIWELVGMDQVKRVNSDLHAIFEILRSQEKIFSFQA